MCSTDKARRRARISRVADYLDGRGIRMAYHHHMGTVVETAEEIERFFQVTTEKVGLVLNTGHAVFFDNIGERENLFDGTSPYAVYVPQNTEYTIEATSENLEIALCIAPGGGDHGIRLIGPDPISKEHRWRTCNLNSQSTS